MSPPAPLLVICPTLERPANVRRLRDSYARTATEGVSELLFVPGDDTCTAKVNRAAAEQVARTMRPKALMFVGDDHLFTTPGWDKLLLEPLLERPGITFPDDLTRPGHPEVFAISLGIVAALKWMMLPTQLHYYVDDAILWLGVRAGCITYMPEIQVPHLHYKVTGQPSDAVYERAHGWLTQDRESYWRWLREDSDAAVEIVRKVVSRGT